MMSLYEKNASERIKSTGNHRLLLLSLGCIYLAFIYMNFSADAQETTTKTQHTEIKKINVGLHMNMFDDMDFVDVNAVVDYWIDVVAKESANFIGDGKVYEDNSSIIHDLREKRVDLVHCTSLDYLTISQQVETDLSYVRIYDGDKFVKYLVLVNSDVQYTDITSLQGLTLAVRKSDNIGVLYLNTHLLKNNMPESKDLFSAILEKEKASRVIMAVFFKKADVCVVEEDTFKTMIELNPQIGRQLKVIDSSPKISNELGFFRKDYKDKEKQEAIRVMTNLHNMKSGEQILTLFITENFEQVDESALESIKELLDEYNDLKSDKKVAERK